MRYKAVLFDLDGTLLDYSTAQRNATSSSAEYELVNSPEVQGYESRGVPQPDSPEMKQAFLDHGIEQDPELFLMNYFQKLSNQGIPIPGAVEILSQLHGEVKLAVVSNGPGEVQIPRLNRAGLTGFFSHHFYSRDMGIAKPDPEILIKALETLDVTEEEVLFIGDSTRSDQPAAEGAGIDFFLFKGTFPHIDTFKRGLRKEGIYEC